VAILNLTCLFRSRDEVGQNESWLGYLSVLTDVSHKLPQFRHVCAGTVHQIGVCGVCVLCRCRCRCVWCVVLCCGMLCRCVCVVCTELLTVSFHESYINIFCSFL